MLCYDVNSGDAKELSGNPSRKDACARRFVPSPTRRLLRFLAANRTNDDPRSNFCACRALHQTDRETDMSDDLKNRGPQDRSRISLTEEWEVAYWTKSLGVSRERLEQLVREHGNSADAVKTALTKAA